MGKRANPTVIGVFVLGAIALTVLGVVTFGSGSFFRRTHPFVLNFPGSVNGLDKGAAVKFRGVQIGTVADIRLRLPGQQGDARIPVLIEVDQDKVTELGATGVRLDDRASVRAAIGRGLRGRLQLQSIITGVLYVDLDIVPGSPLQLVLPEDSSYDEIPTLPTPLEQATATVQDILARLSRIDFEVFGKSMAEAVEGVNRLVNSPDLQGAVVAAREALGAVRGAVTELRPRVGNLVTGLQGTTDDARATLQRLDGALENLRMLVDARAPLAQDMMRTLQELADAARAVRELADYLDRNPRAVLTGRPTP
jgi:paraquat-inducible protein B